MFTLFELKQVDSGKGRCQQGSTVLCMCKAQRQGM